MPVALTLHRADAVPGKRTAPCFVGPWYWTIPCLLVLTWVLPDGFAFPSGPQDRPYLFQLGSGASAPVTTVKPLLTYGVISHPYADSLHAPQYRLERSDRELSTGRDSPEGSKLSTMIAAVPQHRQLRSARGLPTGRDSPEGSNLSIMIAAVLATAAVSALCHMTPAGGGGDGGRREQSHRVPPSWSPEADHSYSFRAFVTDIALWVMLTDL